MRKLFLLLTATAVIFCCTKGYSQTVTFSGKNVPLATVFSAIKSQTGYVFFYEASLLRDAKPVTIQAKNLAIEQVLKEVLKDQQLDYFIEDKTITIVRKEPPIKKEQTPLPPPITVHGRIINETSEPVKATVTVKGSGKASTSTNDNGEFSIAVGDLQNSLIISAVGIE